MGRGKGRKRKRQRKEKEKADRGEGLKYNFCTLVAEGRKKREMMEQSEWKDNCNLVKWMPREE